MLNILLIYCLLFQNFEINITFFILIYVILRAKSSLLCDKINNSMLNENLFKLKQFPM